MNEKNKKVLNDVDRLYVSRKEGGTGLASIQDSVNASILRSEDYIKKRGGKLITTIRNNTCNTNRNRTKITRKQKWEEKQLYVNLKRQTSKILYEKTWIWLRKWKLKSVTESLRIGTQNNAIRTNYTKARTDKTQQNSWCRLCGDRDKMIIHKISKCNK